MGFTRTQSLASSCVMDAPDNTTLPRRKAPVKGRSIAVGGHTPVKGGETRNADRRLQGPDGLRADNENTRTRLRELSEPFGSRPACPQPCTHKPCGRNTDQAPSATCCNTHAPCVPKHNTWEAPDAKATKWRTPNTTKQHQARHPNRIKPGGPWKGNHSQAACR